MTQHTPVEFHPEAIEEAAAARRWYAERNPTAAFALQSELDHAVQPISEAPSRWVRPVSGTRRFVLQRYPFSVVYFELQGSVLVVAVAHALLRRVHGEGRGRKRKGLATVRLSNGAIRRVELHWYEAHGIGRRDFKIKKYLERP